MKKLLTACIIITLVFSLSSVIFAEPLEKQVEIISRKATSTPVIDGTRDAVYNDQSEVYEIKIPTANAEEPLTTGKFWTVWEDGKSYWFFELYDTTPNNSAGNSYERDCIEFFIDFAYERVDGSYGGQDYPNIDQVRILRIDDGGPVIQSTSGDDDTFLDLYPGFAWKVSEMANGWSIEMVFPNAAVKLGGKSGFDVALADDKGEGRRQSHVFFANNSDQAWQQCLDFGADLTYVASKATAVPPVAEVDKTNPKTSDADMLFVILAFVSIVCLISFKKFAK